MKKILGTSIVATAASLAGLALAQTGAGPTLSNEALGNLKIATAATPAQQTRISQIRMQPGTGAILIGMLRADTLRTSAVGQSVNLRVSESKIVQARTVSVENRPGATIWRGEVAGKGSLPPGVATMVMTPGGVTGTIEADDGKTYQLRPLPDGGTAVIEIDYATMPLEDGPGGGAAAVAPAGRLMNARLARPVASGIAAPVAASAAPVVLNTAEVTRRLQPNAVLGAKLLQPGEISISERYKLRPDIWKLLIPPTIDVLVAYTPSAASLSGDINGLINLAIEETNGSFTNSNVWARVRLVGTVQVPYSETGKSYDTIMADFTTNGDGKMDAVFPEREAKKADVVMLVMNQGDWCGQAHDIGATAATAFALVHYSCATGYYSFGHEMAHLIGARHDRETDGTGTPYAWGHGYRHHAASGSWRTIMGYPCSDCNPRKQYWSSPLTLYGGIPMGTAALEDNHRVWNERAPIVAAFR